MQNLKTILESGRREGTSWHYAVPAHWMQGRTSYGGLTAAAAHHAARQVLGTDLPPLRSAQVAFVGPMAGDAVVEVSELRRGKNTVFASVTSRTSEGVGLAGTLIFMNGRDSVIDYHGLRLTAETPPPADDAVRTGPPEFFTYNLEYPEKRLVLGENNPRLASWHRLREREGIDPFTELLAIGDALPPAAMGLMTTNSPISSMNWHVNILATPPAGGNGWWFCESVTHHAERGASSQVMTVFHEDGTAVMEAMQSVALFG